ncbi:MAG: hypothetical protein JWM57_3499 [Phycisphaerales bacterium]|nr:hypothetical protein [Phycisphaerales bacterium]
MTEPLPAIPLSYDAAPRRGDSVVAFIALALTALCATVPAIMTSQLLRGTRHAWGVYTPYAGNFYGLTFRANWPWYALDTIALLAGVVGLQRGRPRFAVTAIVISISSMAAVLTLVLGSPWW